MFSIKENVFENVVCQNGSHLVQGEMSEDTDKMAIFPSPTRSEQSKNGVRNSWNKLYLYIKPIYNVKLKHVDNELYGNTHETYKLS